jgi:intracellular multiplication protein IcmL
MANNTAPAGQATAPTPALQAANTGALELVAYRNNFYRDNYRNLMIVCLGMLLIIGLLFFWGFYERTHKPVPQYFATTYDGKLIALTPLNEPNLQDNALLQWATEAAVNSYTFNFVNFRKALQDIRIYFTKNGYLNFLKALKDSNNLDAVQNKKLVVSAVPTGAPVILRKGLYKDGSVSGVYGWNVQMPMVLTYQSATEQFKQNIVLNLLITRMSTLESPKGVGIASFVVSEGKQ